MTLYQFQLDLADVALRMMERGVNVDGDVMKSLEAAVAEALATRIAAVEAILGEKFTRFNADGEPTFFGSSVQIKALMEKLGQRPGTNRKTGRDAFDDETLFRIGVRTPGLKPLCWAIMEFRTLRNMRANFLRARREPNGKLRTSWNTAGPETFRWSSSTNAFWRGANLENIAKPFHSMTGTALPNLRSAIVPSTGCLLWERDLAGADAQVVAWDSGDEVLKQMFREKVKIHAVTSREVYGGDAGPDGRREPYYTLAKKGRHAWHYGAKSRTIGMSLGITVKEADKLIARMAGLNPMIPKWHERVKVALHAPKHMITNAFGYRIIFFGRPDDCLPQALAWIGQGTVACVINRACVALDAEVPEAPLLMNQHDSLVGENQIDLWPATSPRIEERFTRIVVPYPDPLVIPTELKTSTISWGDMEKENE
jgi:DNA polymerase I-like protein with 3'-5' exonuclease and polymerase domains